jgi:two-component system, NarL family, sensor kinase
MRRKSGGYWNAIRLYFREAAAITAAWILIFIASPAFSQRGPSLDSLEKKVETLVGAEKAYVLYELVYGYLRVDIRKAEQYAHQVNAALKNESDPAALSYLTMARGIYFARSGRLDSAVYWLDEAKKSAMVGGGHHALVRVYAALGHTYISSGKPEKGIENMFAGLRVLDEHPDTEMEMKLRTNVAWAFLELKQYRNCIRHGLDNLRKMEGTPFEWIALYTYNNVAISYGALGFLDSAKYFITKGIRAAEKSNDMQSLANGYFILGTIYSNAGQYDRAIAQYLKARPYREKVGNPLFIVADLYTMSDLYFKSGDYKKGVQTGHEALAMAEKYNLLLKFEGTYLSLAQNYEGLNDFKNASRYYRLWATVKDSVYRNANTEAIAEMETRYETEKKEQQLAVQRAGLAEQEADLERTYVVIVALAITLVLVVIIFVLLRNRLRRKRQLFLRDAQIHATIQSQENERRRFARDLHDGMGQLISALRLALHSIHRETPLEERVSVASKAEHLLNDMHQEIRSIAFNLMPQTLVQSGLVPALREMASRVQDSTRIAVRVMSLDLPDRLSELQEISLYRIIQEWTNNVIKYAGASQVDIQLIGYEEEISVVVEDNGNGFDVKLLHQSAGNGWKNIRSRVNLVRGSLDIDSRPGRAGTTLIIRVPVTKAVAVTVQPNTQ